MKSYEQLWGDNSTTFDSLMLRSAGRAVRVLLPLSDLSGEEYSWQKAIEDSLDGPRIDGYVSWSHLAEFSGDGSSEPLARYTTASGVISESTATALVDAIEQESGSGCGWFYRPDPITSHVSVPLEAAEAGLEGGSVNREGIDGQHVKVVTADDQSCSLIDLMERWMDGGISGYTWREDGAIGIAAPAYADSVIVSGSVDLVERLMASELEAYPIARSATQPYMGP